MNILIVGNGFDLSHYLPTKYDHFMIAMDAIENWDIAKGDMGFDDLFIKDYWHKNNETEEWQNSFFQHTKAMYKTEEIKISVDKIQNLQAQLKENVWYQYFSDYVREVKTWIDFELKIYEALSTVEIFFDRYHELKDNLGIVNKIIVGLNGQNSNNYLCFKERERLVLKSLGIIEIESEHNEEIYNIYKIKDNFLDEFKGDITLDCQKIISFLMANLLDLKTIFSDFLMTVIDNLEINFTPENVLFLDLIYTFNYTVTLVKKYNTPRGIVKYIHGENEKKNIVLGVSDLSEQFLKNYKTYGFTKYHQKLLNDTEYQFLSESAPFKANLNFWMSKTQNLDDKDYFSTIGREYQTNIYIWGHSLDRSDENYIKEIFSFNEPRDCNVRVQIFYFDIQAKFDLLANLIGILTKEKVEKWMKKGWLKFEPNPDIAKLNNITPVDLPKP